MTDVRPLSPAVRAALAADAVMLGSQDTLSTRVGLSVPKLETGIPGFDSIAMGGLTRRRAAVLAGQAGSGKTVFAAHFIAEGVRRGQPGVFVTMEEPAADLRANMATLGWDVAAWEASGDLGIVDASPVMRDDGALAPYSFETVAAQIGHAVDRTGAERLVIDSLNSVLAFEERPAIARQKLRGLISSLRGMGLTVILTVETPDDPGKTLSSFGIEEFVADSVILLRHLHQAGVRRRTVEVLKMRGAMHRKGDYGFTILAGQGVVVLPQAVSSHGQETEPRRLSSGNPVVDELTGGGFFHDALVLVNGPTGAGKTLLGIEFLAAGLAAGERVLLFSYEENPGQVFRNAAAWGHDLVRFQENGQLEVVALYPEVASLDDHLIEIMETIDKFKPNRVVIDSLSSLARVSSAPGYREFVIALTAFVKQERVALFATLPTEALLGSAAKEDHISTLTDTIILLRYVPTPGEVQRVITVLKMRGSAHDNSVRRYTITSAGMQIGEPYDTVVEF